VACDRLMKKYEMSSLLARMAALAFGRESEETAARFLKKNGYRILQKNFRCKGGEIDIIAREGDTLVFCEVKARKNKKFGSALEGVTPAKIKKIKKAAEVFMLKNGLTETDCRFDVVTIDGEGSSRKIEIIPNAF